MTSDELKQITRHREKRTLEYKEAWSELPGNMFETVCAFLNRDGGVIVLGAHDDGSITEGVNPRAIDQICKNIANVSNNAEMLNPAYLLQPEIVEVEDSSRDKVFREVVSNILIHREYLNPAFTMIDVRIDHVLVQNASRPLRTGVLTPDNFTPHPKNPHLANFFVQMGRGEHLGSGVLNLYHYAPLYMGAEPTITDDDMFCIRLNIAESKRAELAMLPISNPDTESSEKSVQKTIRKTIQKSGVEHGVDKLTDRQHVIMSLIRQFVVEHVVEGGVEDGVEKLSVRIIAQKLKSSSRTIQRELSYLQEKGLIRRIGSDAKGYYAIVE